jgi:hypothetical protein
MKTGELPQVTEAQIVAAQLRMKAADLLRLAEQLEATAPAVPRRRRSTKKEARSLLELVRQAG